MRDSLGSDVAEIEAMVTRILESARLRHAAAALNLEPVDMGEQEFVADIQQQLLLAAQQR